MTTTTIKNAESNGQTPVPRRQESAKHGSADGARRVYTPRFDLWEGDEEYILYGDMPGVSADSLDIQFEDGRLSINGRVEVAGREYHSAEYGVGNFYREFTVGETVKAEEITAEMRDGVVTIRLPNLRL